MNRKKIIIGTRGSALALTQTEWVADQLRREHPDLEVDKLVIKTKGDKILDVPLALVGGKGLFVKEIEEALLDGRADLAVHSMKDVPADLPAGLFIAAVPVREDFRDALVTRQAISFDQLPDGAVVGTSSLRRKAQLLKKRPDLNIRNLRGNLDTRLRKLTEENLDAIVVAAAGLSRMNLSHRAHQFLEPDLMLPAIGQGALGIEARESDDFVLDKIAFLHHGPTATRVAAERAFLMEMEGGCQVPLGALAQLEGDNVTLTAFVSDIDGQRYLEDKLTGPASDAADIGTRLARTLLDRGGREIMAELNEPGPGPQNPS